MKKDPPPFTPIKGGEGEGGGGSLKSLTPWGNVKAGKMHHIARIQSIGEKKGVEEGGTSGRKKKKIDRSSCPGVEGGPGAYSIYSRKEGKEKNRKKWKKGGGGAIKTGKEREKRRLTRF